MDFILLWASSTLDFILRRAFHPAVGFILRWAFFCCGLHSPAVSLGWGLYSAVGYLLLGTSYSFGFLAHVGSILLWALLLRFPCCGLLGCGHSSRFGASHFEDPFCSVSAPNSGFFAVWGLPF